MALFDALFERDLFTVRRYGPGPKDTLGRTTRIVVNETVSNGLLRPTGSVEGEAFVVNEYAATFPLGTDLTAADEVVARGATYTVEGTPFVSVIPKTQIGVLTARLKYVGPASA